MNYNLEMKKQMTESQEGSSLLLHACCAPCSSAVLEKLANYFKITILYFNPNITDKNEYNKRLDELKRFVKKLKYKYEITILDGRYNPEEFLAIAKGLEDEPERGKRCYKCYNLRLEETAKIAKKLKFDFFATTLTLSPHKNADWLNEIGKELGEKYKSNYLYSDFKKENGYKRSIELSKEYELYRQNYCGCIYSKVEKLKKNSQN